MNELYNSLINGTKEYKEDGTEIARPPSPLMLRAARAIKQLFDQSNMLAQTNAQCQAREAQLLEELHQLRVKYQELEMDHLELVNKHKEPEPLEPTAEPTQTT